MSKPDNEYSRDVSGYLLVPVALLLGVVLLAIFWPVLKSGRGAPARRVACVSNVKQLVTALAIYQADWDDKNPPDHWQTSIMPYVKMMDLYTCPEVKRLGLTNGYAMNHAVAGKLVPKIAGPATTVELFETANLTGDRNARLTEQAYRDHGGKPSTVVGYVDTHVKVIPRP